MNTLNDQGIAAARSGDFAKARQFFEQAIQAEPDRAAAYVNLTQVLLRFGEVDRAEQIVRIAICLQPDDGDNHVVLARLLMQRGRWREAIVSAGHATRLMPTRADAWRMLADLFARSGQIAAAVDAYERLLLAAPRDAAALNELGNLYQQLGRIADSEESYKRASDADPNLAVALANRARLVSDRGDASEASALYAQAAKASTSPQMHIAAATVLPVVYDSLEQVAEYRARLVRELDRLYEAGVRIDPTQQVLPNFFYLAYQGQNDREVMTRFAKLLLPVERRGVRLPEVKPSGGKKLRLGIACRYLCDHTIGRLNLLIAERLPRDKFEIVLFKMTKAEDEITRRYSAAADVVAPLSDDLPQALATIASAKVDVLFYPELGMDPLTFTLAASRLAPVQVSTWGHPDTAGLPTMDAFLSIAAELPEADSHFTEKLIRLPQLGVGLERPPAPLPTSREKFGLPERGTLYGCPQSLFKMTPDFDTILGEILRKDATRRVLLLDGHHAPLTQRLQRRFAKALADVQDRIVWLPRMARAEYRQLASLCDVMLDPPQFGGGHTSYEAFAYGVPVVTLPSPYLRGRLTLSMLQRLELTKEMVAQNEADYATRAVSIGTNADERRTISQQLHARAGDLFEDAQAIQSVGDAFLRLSGRE